MVGQVSPMNSVGGGIHKGGERVICMAGTANQQRIDRERRRVRPGISVCGCGGNGGGVWKRPAFHWYSQQESIWLTGFCFDIHGINRNFKQNGNFIWIFWLSGRFYWPATFTNVLTMVRNCHGYTINLNTLKFNSLICKNLRTYLLLLLMIMSYFSFLELSWVSRRQWSSSGPSCSLCIHIITVSLSLSLSQSGRRLIYRLPENRLVVRRRRHRHCNDCNEVRPKVWNSLGASIAVCCNLPSMVYISTDTGRSIRMIFCIICFQTFRNVRVILISHFCTSKLCLSVPLWLTCEAIRKREF